MAFIPHTHDDVRQMLATIGVDDVEALFSEIPPALRVDHLAGMPGALTELEVTRLMQERAQHDHVGSCFIGAGAYEHHVPAAVWQIATRGEFYSAYTPYQAEASQGTLQLIYEFQTMAAELTAMDAANASMYDGASALAEAVLMAVRANRKSTARTVLVPRSVNPTYVRVVEAIVSAQDIRLEFLDFDRATGRTALESLDEWKGRDIAAVVIPQPNFFGQLEVVDELTDWAHDQGALAIAVVNPLALAILKPPGEWGDRGVDIACGEGQPLGVPLSSGGPYFGFMTTSTAHLRQMPGRIVGRTIDADGKPGFTLTLQAREQHIRRSKATSNICTNQGLLVTAATIYMTLLGPEGLARVAGACHANTRKLVQALETVSGVKRVFVGACFHEVVVSLDRRVGPVLAALAEQNIEGGYDLGADYPELGNALLICATETKTDADIDRYVSALSIMLDQRRAG